LEGSTTLRSSPIIIIIRHRGTNKPQKPATAAAAAAAARKAKSTFDRPLSIIRSADFPASPLSRGVGWLGR